MKQRYPFLRVLSSVYLYIGIIAIWVALSFFYHSYALSVGGAVVTVLLLCYNLVNRASKQTMKRQYLDNVAVTIGDAQRTVTYIPLPMLILTVQGDCIWHNEEFEKLSGQNVVNAHIGDILPTLRLVDIFEHKCVDLYVDMGDRYLQVVSDYMPSSTTADIITLYFIDRTSERETRRELNDKRTLCCLLNIDNYDDLLKATPETQHTQLIAEIERQIHQWVSYMCGTARRYEKDKYHIIFEHVQYEKAVADKFAFIEQIHKINVGNRIPVTLSMGVGLGQNIVENLRYAQTAMEMALGRGGDQVVIKTEDTFQFFGGNIEHYAKSTRVKARVVSHALAELIESSDTVFILMHRRPDMDSFGAAIGLTRIVKELKRPVYVVFDVNEGTISEVTNLFSDEPYVSMFTNEDNALSMCTHKSLAIVVDTHNPGYIEATRLLNMSERRVLIDHHRQSTNFVDKLTLLHHEPLASSTCEMVSEMIQYIEPARNNLTSLEAQAMYIGIMLDTKNFTTRSGVRTFEAAAYLRSFGVDILAVRRIFQNDLSSYIKRAKIIQGTEIIKNIYAVSRWEVNEQHRANILCSQAADELLNISGVEASFVICRNDDVVLISARSLGSVNVQVIMEALGGGGHLTGAGTQLRGITIDEAYGQLRQILLNS